MFKTWRIGSQRCNCSWQPVEKCSRVENFPNGAELATELENRHTRKAIGGSNPYISATQSGTPRNLAPIPARALARAAISRILLTRRTGKSVPLYPAGKFCRVFL